MDESTMDSLYWPDCVDFCTCDGRLGIGVWLMAGTRVAETPAESASLWAIRIALGLMVLVFAIEIRGGKSTDRTTASLWLVGALLSLCHSLGSLATFHHGSQSMAIEATAQQTQELIGIRVGAGHFVNYAFDLVWLADAMVRMISPAIYSKLPKGYRYGTNGFLIFMAINGAIVFQSGWIRAIGLACVTMLLLLSLQRRNALSRRLVPRP